MGNCLSPTSVEPAQPVRQVDFKERPVSIPEDAIKKLSPYYKYSGGLADIWECSWHQASIIDGRVTKVAVKSIRIPSAEDETLIRQTQRKIRLEAHVWMQLEHDNILKFYGVVEGFGLLPALVSPWMENGSLDNYLTKRSSVLPVGEAFDMLVQITAGLQYLHDTAGIIHGDLTCTNILMSDDGRLYLADFGLSLILEEAQNATFNSTHVGNMRWMAPERISPPEGESAKPTKPADMYSYGCIMLHLLSGRKPYHWLKQAPAVSKARIEGTGPFRDSEIVNVEDGYKIHSLRCLSGNIQERPDVSGIIEFLRRPNN